MDTQRASGCGTCSRFHVRLNQTGDSDTIVGITTTAPTHHEDFVIPCGHAVDKTVPPPQGEGSGFDQGRAQITWILHTTHGNPEWEYWGNTQSFEQCDGDEAASDGWTAWMLIPSWNH